MTRSSSPIAMYSVPFATAAIKLIRYPLVNVTQLFDLQADPTNE